MIRSFFLKNFRYIVFIALVSCVGTVKNSADTCQIFEDNYFWYKAVKSSEKKWGAPVELQMAFIQRESDFDFRATPGWDKLFKIIPYKRKSSSYGYSQAVDKTWEQYQNETGNKYALRISFYDSIDFIGWYINKTNKLLRIPKNDYFRQYIAYHEGWGQYKNYTKSPDAIKFAKAVDRVAKKYKYQLDQCKHKLSTDKYIIF
jgi:hypothetical protein